MQTFVRLHTGKTITLEFVNGVTTIFELKLAVLDREGLSEDMIGTTRILNVSQEPFDDSHILTRAEFGDKTFCFKIDS